MWIVTLAYDFSSVRLDMGVSFIGTCSNIDLICPQSVICLSSVFYGRFLEMTDMKLPPKRAEIPSVIVVLLWLQQQFNVSCAGCVMVEILTHIHGDDRDSTSLGFMTVNIIRVLLELCPVDLC